MTSAQKARVARGVARVQADLDRHVSLQTAMDNLSYLVVSPGGKRRPGQFTTGDLSIIRQKFEKERNMAGKRRKTTWEPMVTYPSSRSGNYVLLRDGKEVTRGSEQDVRSYIHRHHSYSIDHALKHEGYKIVPVEHVTGANFVLSTGRRAKSRVGAHRATRTRRHLGASVNRAGKVVSTKPVNFGEYQVVYLGDPSHSEASPFKATWGVMQDGKIIRGPAMRHDAVFVVEMATGKHEEDMNRTGSSHRENENGLTFSRWLDAAGGTAHVDRVAPGAAFKAWRGGEDPSDYRAARNRAGGAKTYYVVGYNYKKGHRDRRFKYQGGVFPTRSEAMACAKEVRSRGFYVDVTTRKPKGWYEAAAA